MIRFALALSLVFAVGCDKSGSPSGEAEAAQTDDSTETAAAELTAAKPAPAEKVADAVVAAKPATEAEAEGASCAGGESCGEEMGGGCNQWDEAAAELAKREAPADAEWKVLAVTGMTCGGCERRVIANVGPLEGVLAVEADAELGQVRVAVAKGNEAVADTAADKIRSLGYQIN